MEKGEWKIREKIDGKGVWLGEEGRRKRKIVRSNCIFSELTRAQFLTRTQFPQNGGENQIDNEVQSIGLKCPHARWQCFFFIFLVPFGSFNFSYQFCFLFFSCHFFFSSVLVFLIRSYSFLFFSGNSFGFLNVLCSFFFFLTYTNTTLWSHPLPPISPLHFVSSTSTLSPYTYAPRSPSSPSTMTSLITPLASPPSSPTIQNARLVLCHHILLDSWT